GQPARALQVAGCGAVIAFALTEAIGLLAAWRPEVWLSLFGTDPAMLSAGTAYLTAVGPAYGFFGLGLVLYFASQGAGRLLWPLIGGFVRVAIAVGGGWLALALAGLSGLFAALAAGLVAYGLIVATAVWRGVWFDSPALASQVVDTV
ncbi:MAG: MATE family efflux transporter, partial [Parafilimonas terrae]|nr:MATE family efflux transporter [Parafilimonas terrae]